MCIRDRLRTKTPSIDQFVGNLSGGNQQKVVAVSYTHLDVYKRQGLDIAFTGALEVDQHGNVNVVRHGDKIIGVGGFNYVTSTPKTVVFCTKFMSKSGYQRDENGKPVPFDGGAKKLVADAEYINFNGEVATENGQRVLYITERCVFELKGGKMTITEVSPYVDLQKDILDPVSYTHLDVYKRQAKVSRL